MHKVIQLIIRNGAEARTIDVVHGGGQIGLPMRVQALKGARYELQDPLNKGLGPSTIHSTRRGKDLHIGWNEQADADMVLVDYFEVTEAGDPGAGLYGKAEDGQLNRYVFSDSANGASLVDLQETTVSVSQVLMPPSPPPNFELSASPSIAVGGANPYTFAGAVALAAADGAVIRPSSSNVAAVIEGEIAAELKESDAVQTATGTLTISDVDSPASFVAQTNTAGHNGYGKFSLTTAGVWTYVMDTAHNEFVNGVFYTDSFTVSSVDGTLKTVTVTIRGANDAPVLEPHVFALPAIAQDADLPSGVIGSLVTDFFGVATDLDAVTANGVAITGINANGVLYYSVNGGVDWLAATDVSRENALLLSSNSTNRVYFQPNAGYYGEIADAVVFRAWDASAGVDGIYANAAIAGGESAYSIDFSTLSQRVVRGVSIDDVSIDNMLSPNEAMPLTGISEPSATVTFNMNGVTRSVTADSSGHWSYSPKLVPLVRYVMVRDVLDGSGANTGTGVFAIDELNVFVDGEKVSLGKTVAYGRSTSKLGATAKITDGILMTVDSSSYYETDSTGEVWIQVDLGDYYRVDSIEVFPRQGWANRLNDAKIYASVSDMSGMTSAQLDAASTGASPTISCTTITGATSVNGVVTGVSYVQPNSGDEDALFAGENTLLASEWVDGVSSVTSQHVMLVVPPIVMPTSNVVSYTELSPAIAVNNGLVLKQGSSQYLTGASVSIELGFTTGDVLEFVARNGITGSYNSATGLMTLTGRATVTQYQDALQSVSYRSTSRNPTEKSTQRGVRWVVTADQNGIHNSDVGVSTFGITPINDAAEIGGALTGSLTESNLAQRTSGNLTISDVDSTPSFVAQTDTAGNNGYGKFSLTTAGSWTYVMNSAQDHFASGRSYTDGFDAVAIDGTRKNITVTISGTNDAPVLTPSALTLGEVQVNASAPTGMVGTLVSTLVTGVADLDDDALNGVAISAVSARGKFYYSTNNGANWTLSDSVSDSHALLLGSDAQTRVYFQPTADLSDGPMDGITLRAWDRTNAGVAGGYADTTANGEATSFSTQTNVVTLDITHISVNPVSVDNLLHLGETASISGLALPGAQISLTFPSGQVKSVTADSLGAWSLSVSAGPQTARYVMLRKTSLNRDPYGIDSVWNVSDIKVMSNGTNVAANQAAKLSWVSATTSDLTNGLTSDFAEVNAVGTNWIQIDLGSALPIDSVQVFARSGWGIRLNGTSVYMSNTDMSVMGVDQLASASGVFRGEVTAPSTVESSFTYDFLRMSSGLNNVSVHVVDSVGNSDRSLALTVDDASPVPPQITLHKDTGTDLHDGITSDNQVSVSMASNDVVGWTYSTDAGLTWQAGTGNNFLLDLGEHAADTVKVRAYDASGNCTMISNSQAYEIIEKASISWIETDSQSQLIEGFKTADSTPVLRGLIDDSLTSSERIAVYVDGVYGGVASVNGLTWSYAPSSLSANTHTLEWRLERSVNGQWQAATEMRKHEVTVVASDGPRLFNLSELEDGIEFSGKSTPLTKLKLDWAGKVSTVITSDAIGNWSYTYYKQESLFGSAAPAADVLNTLRLYELDVTGSTVVRTLFTHETLLDVTAPRLLSWQTNLADGVSGVAPGQSLTLTFNFSEDPADGFSLNSFSVFGGTLSQLAGAGQQRTVVFTANQVNLPTLASVYLVSSSWHDAAGNPVAQDVRIGLPIEAEGLAALKPITQTFHVKAGQVVALDLRDPAVNVSSSDWQVKISGLSAGMTLDHGSVANGIWTVSGADLSSLHLSTSQTDQGLLSVDVRYEHKNASGQWQAYSNVQLNGQIQPWFNTPTDSDTEDFSNFTQIQQAWNLGLTGHGISIGINEGSAINVNTATDFELGNVLAGSASGTTPSHAHGVGQRAAGAATSSFVGVAYDANMKWINGNATGLDVTSWSVSARAIDGAAWDVPETVTGRGGLGTVWAVAASNMGSDGNTSLLRSTKSPAAMAIASIDNQTGEHASFSAPGQAVWVAHPGWGGTSSATPAVAGEAALMLEVNPALGVRDVKSILAMSATYYKTSTPLASFEMNAANTLNGSGMHYSNYVGFGTSNVYNAVRLSKDWLRQGVAQTMANWVTTTPVVATAGTAINASTGNITTVQIQVTDDVQLEALQVINTLKTDSFSKLRIWVTSPSGTISELTRSSTVGAYDAVLEMSSNKFFGESSKGTWTVSYEFTQDAVNSGLVSNLSLRLFGSANQVVDRYVYTDEFSLQLSLANNATRQSMHWLGDSDGGVDAVMGSAMQSQIQIDLGHGGYVHLMGEKVHVLAGTRIENAFGGDGNDLLIGGHDVGAILGGNAGDDTLISRGHSSLLEGGEGQDRIWLVRGDRAAGGEGADRFFIKQDQFSFANVSDLRSAMTDFDVTQDTLFAIDSQGQLKTAQFTLDGSFQTWQSVRDVTVLEEFSQMTQVAGVPVLNAASIANQTLTLGFDSVMANTVIDLNALQINGSAVTSATWSESTLTLTTGSVLTAGARLHFTDGPIHSGLGVGWHVSDVEMGTSGNDILDASSSQTNTVLMGQGGSDTVKAGSGDDYLWSTYDAGRTILMGGAGADHFALKASASNSVAGSTTIKDFSVSEGDVLVLTDVLSNFSSTRVLDQWLSLSATPDNLSAKLRFDYTGKGVFIDSGYTVVLENFYTHHSALATASLTDWVNSGILVA